MHYTPCCQAHNLHIMPPTLILPWEPFKWLCSFRHNSSQGHAPVTKLPDSTSAMPHSSKPWTLVGLQILLPWHGLNKFLLWWGQDFYFNPKYQNNCEIRNAATAGASQVKSHRLTISKQYGKKRYTSNLSWTRIHASPN